jgi:hypothetical protein
VCLVFEVGYRNHFHSYPKPGHFFRVVAFVPVISSTKQTNLVLALFFCRA